MTQGSVSMELSNRSNRGRVCPCGGRFRSVHGGSVCNACGWFVASGMAKGAPSSPEQACQERVILVDHRTLPRPDLDRLVLRLRAEFMTGAADADP
jgi:hypothetical protein